MNKALLKTSSLSILGGLFSQDAKRTMKALTMVNLLVSGKSLITMPIEHVVANPAGYQLILSMILF